MVLQLLFLNIWKHLADVQTLAEHRLLASLYTAPDALFRERHLRVKKWAKGQEEIVSEEKSPA